MKPKVYLAGPITGLTYAEAIHWRSVAKMLLSSDIHPVDPLRGKEYLMCENAIEESYEQHPASTSDAIIGRDRFDVMHSDMMLAYFIGCKQASIGTAMEYGWADILRIPVVTIAEKDNIHRKHPMIARASIALFETLEDGIDFINVTLRADRC